jgi:hypothetical protein
MVLLVKKYSIKGDNICHKAITFHLTLNFCEQILIFRIELDNDIASIPRAPVNFQVNTEAVFRNEANRETSHNESLADDNTILTLLTRKSLSAIKNILQ